MVGTFPEEIERFRLTPGLERQIVRLRPPAPGELVVRVCGVALGVEPDAEIAGWVVAAGDAAAEWLGRRVVVPRLVACGECARCRRGFVATCAGRAARAGFATHETVAARSLLSVEPPLWPFAEAGEEELWRLAALADAASGPYAALVRMGVQPGERVLVIGGGVRGAFAIALAHAMGAQPVLLGDPDADALRETDWFKVIETTCTAAGRQRALALVPPGGTLALLDGGSDDDDGPGFARWEHFARSEATVVGVSGCHPDLLPELCALAVRSEIPLVRLTVRVRLEEAAAALAAHRSGALAELPIVTL